MKSRIIGAGLAVHAAVLLLAVPRSPWEFDEPLFFQALHDYDPRAHHPPPPGYPVFILFAQLVRQVIPSDFATLAAISTVASAVGFVMLALAFIDLTGDERAGVSGALLFYLSPAMLVHSTLPISDPGGLALLAAGLYFSTRCIAPHPAFGHPLPASGARDMNFSAFAPRSGEKVALSAAKGRMRGVALFAVFCSLAIGWRIQLCIFVVPFFLTALFFIRRRVLALAVFTITCLAWLTPLAIAVGGVQELIAFETGQGQYVASHDAAESRTGWTLPRIVFRFVGRAWGFELMAAVVLVAALVGFVLAMRTRWRALLPFVAGGAVYIAVALLVMDPADGVRYALPFTMVVALFAGVAVARLRGAYIVAAIAVIPFLYYTGALLWQRHTTTSPPVAAALHAKTTQPKNAVVLYELALWPHTTYYLREFQPHRVDDGLEKFYDRPDVPLFIYADGDTARRDAHVFRWHTSDAYEKLTRNHYRVASIIPVPPERRYRVISGIYGPERTQEGFEWRWMSPLAELQLPKGSPRRLTLRLGLSSFAPIESNDVMLFVDGVETFRAPITRGVPSAIIVDVPAGAPVIRIEARRAFVPANIPELRSGDRRTLAVEFYELTHVASR